VRVPRPFTLGLSAFLNKFIVESGSEGSAIGFIAEDNARAPLAENTFGIRREDMALGGAFDREPKIVRIAGSDSGHGGKRGNRRDGGFPIDLASGQRSWAGKVADHNQCLAGSNFSRFRRGNLRLVGIIVRDNFERMTVDTTLAVNLVKVEVNRIKRFFTAVFQWTTQRYDDRNSNRVLGRSDSINNVGQQTENECCCYRECDCATRRTPSRSLSHLLPSRRGSLRCHSLLAFIGLPELAVDD
jgi:hypothetical protein